MPEKSLCRIGVFYDGSYFTYARHHYFRDRNLGWLDFRPFHALIESYLRTKEQVYTQHRVVYGGWFQGMFSVTQANAEHLKKDRRLHQDLLHAGIEPKFVPMPYSGNTGEKGADVALAIDAMQVGLDGKIDIAVLVTGDGDFVPLVRTLMKQGIRVAAAFFEYKDDKRNSFINERLRVVCNYLIDINALEKDKDFKDQFKSLFRKADDQKQGTRDASSLES